jgi:hypothetical protein
MLSIVDNPLATSPGRRRFGATRAQRRALMVALLASAGMAIRLFDLAASGYSEDEVKLTNSPVHQFCFDRATVYFRP